LRAPPPGIDARDPRRLITLTEAAFVTTLSIETLKRLHGDKIRRLSPGRLAMSLADAHAIGARTPR
jgi:hypothetical protein